MNDTVEDTIVTAMRDARKRLDGNLEAIYGWSVCLSMLLSKLESQPGFDRERFLDRVHYQEH